MSDADRFRDLAVKVETLRGLLLMKGVFTEQEFDTGLAIATSYMDQLIAESKAKALANMDPVERMMYDALVAWSEP